MASVVGMHVQPQHSLMDDKIEIQVTGLDPLQPITVAALLDENKMQYVSHGHFNADQEGVVDLTKMASSGGTYTGMEPEGLLWSLVPAPGQKKGIRMMKKDVTKPHTFQLSVLSNHVEANSLAHHKSDGTLAQTSITRSYMASWVERIPVRHGPLRGVLFCPKGGGQFPGVIDLYGTAGGLVEYRASLLASRGFTTLALAYFAYDDLRTTLDSIDMEYFEEALEWLSQHPSVSPGGIGMLGISKGGELALLAATLFPKIHAVVCVSGMCVNSFCESTYKGRVIPGVMPDFSKVIMSEEGMGMCTTWLHDNVSPLSEIQVHEAENAQFLFLHGGSDVNIDPLHAVRNVKHLIDHKKQNYECHIYNGAGHLLEPPYVPFSYATYHKAYDNHFLWGGELRKHAKAQVEAWECTQTFLRKNLPPPHHPSKL